MENTEASFVGWRTFYGHLTVHYRIQSGGPLKLGSVLQAVVISMA